MEYNIDPGIYALGQPDRNSPVLVSANYKMSFDFLRAELSGYNAWILVLDTKGINVWCAAGKGTFGTDELLRRIASSSLSSLVSHRNLILPQLSAPGVSAHIIKKESGFKVHYGPIRASDIPVFLDSGLKATPDMRQKTFTLKERMVLIPIELMAAMKVALFVIPIIFILSGFAGRSGFFINAFNNGLFGAVSFMSAVLAGSVLFPIFLPFLPGRAFSFKGLILGVITAAFVAYSKFPINSAADLLNVLSWYFLICALTAYIAMNFTGASTYTSLSGVKKEMSVAVPMEVGAALIGVILWTVFIFVV